MIVFNPDLLFVHNPKTAGTSIATFLMNRLPDARAAGVTELGTYHPSLSMSLGYACAMLGVRPEQLLVLIAVRDPFDRERSMYSYFRRHLATSPTLREDMNDPEMERWVATAARLDFNAYLSKLWHSIG